jgi:hypothetical protein
VSYPSLVKYSSENEYRKHFENIYCRKPITTFDGIEVRFRKNKFDHCFFETVHTQDDTFSKKRAERIDWIKEALQDPKGEQYIGYDKRRKRNDSSRRVTVVKGNYVTVIKMVGKNKAEFVTAFVADTPGRKGIPSTIDKIRKSPEWT